MKLELIKPKKVYNRVSQKNPRINFERLRDQEVATRYKDRVELKLEERYRNEPD